MCYVYYYVSSIRQKIKHLLLCIWILSPFYTFNRSLIDIVFNFTPDYPFPIMFVFILGFFTDVFFLLDVHSITERWAIMILSSYFLYALFFCSRRNCFFDGLTDFQTGREQNRKKYLILVFARSILLSPLFEVMCLL